MKIIQPDEGTGIQPSRFYARNLQIWQGFRVTIDGEQAEIRMPAPYFAPHGAGPITVETPMYGDN